MKNILLTITGSDSPGITAQIMDTIASHRNEIIDMGQSLLHGLLSLSVLISVENEDEMIKDLLFKTNKMKMSLDYKVIHDVASVSEDGTKYILSCVNTEGITAEFLKDLSHVLGDNKVNIKKIDNISKKENFDCLNISTVAQDMSIKELEVKEQLLMISSKHQTDLALIKDDNWRQSKRLIVFDMDSTLIQSEVIVEMAKLHGVGEKVHQVTESAMRGEIDFKESLKQRVALLEGLEVARMHSLLSNINITDGVEDFLKIVHSLGYKTAIISGGFQFFADHFKNKLNMSYAYANNLEIEDGKLTGEVAGKIVDAKEKAILLEELAKVEKIKTDQVVAIGDGANDLEMLAKAGLGIAFHAKDIVKKSAKHSIGHGGMLTILPFLGIKNDEHI